MSGAMHIQTQADKLMLLLNNEIDKAVNHARNQILLQLRKEMEPIIDGAFNAGKNSNSIASTTTSFGYNENGRIQHLLALEQRLFAGRSSASNNSITNGEEARASQQLRRLLASLAEFGIAVSDTEGSLRFETTSGWNTVLVNLGITNVNNLRELLDALTKRLQTDHQHINDLYAATHSRDKTIQELSNRVNTLEQQRNMLLKSMKFSLTTDPASTAAMNHLPSELANLAVLNLPMDMHGFSENPSGCAPSPACQHPAGDEPAQMG